MITHGIQTPRLTEFTKHDVVDSIALNFSRAFRQHLAHHNDVLDVDRFVDWLDISTEWDFFDETDSSSLRLAPTFTEFAFATRSDIWSSAIAVILRPLITLRCSRTTIQSRQTFYIRIHGLSMAYPARTYGNIS